MTAYELASHYGVLMKRYGMSQYNERMDYDDVRGEVREREDFKELSKSDQSVLMEYLHNCYRYGMGMYQERGACADYYDELHGAPPQIPFNIEITNEPEENE